MKLITDKFYHGDKKKKGFFEGWYLKHTLGEQVYAFIPGVSIEKGGKKSPFIQIIHNDTSHILFFDAEDFKADSDRFHVEIGKNKFSNNGMVLDIDRPDEGFCIKGEITYGPFSILERTAYMPSIMGPYSYFNYLECYHGLVSMNHTLSGALSFNHEYIDFDQGRGYIEKDWGTSFPKAWIWTQCNGFSNHQTSFFLSVADIPFMRFKFLGLISVLYFEGKTYRFGTYLGGKVVAIKRQEDCLWIKIKQKKHNLEVMIKEKESHTLLAPVVGDMNRPIKETISGEIEVTLMEDEKIIFQGKGIGAGIETIGNVRNFTY